MSVPSTPPPSYTPPHISSSSFTRDQRKVAAASLVTCDLPDPYVPAPGEETKVAAICSVLDATQKTLEFLRKASDRLLGTRSPDDDGSAGPSSPAPRYFDRYRSSPEKTESWTGVRESAVRLTKATRDLMYNRDSSRIADLEKSRTEAFKDLESREYEWFSPQPISEVPNEIFARALAIGKHPDFFPRMADEVTRDTNAFLQEKRIADLRRIGQGVICEDEVDEDEDG